MRRIALVAGLLVAMTLVGGNPPARADFHGLCTGPAGGAAGLTFTHNPAGSLDFSGFVRCDGADSLAIPVGGLTLTPVVPSGPEAFGSSASCSPCGDRAITSSGSTSASPGTYHLQLSFYVDGAERGRYRGYVFIGTGQPTPYCGSGQLFQCVV